MMKRNKILVILTVCVFWIFSTAYADQATLTEVRVFKTEEATRIIFNTTQSITPRIFLLTNPNRLVVDFKDTTLKIDPSVFKAMLPTIQGIRTGHPTPTTLRIVIDVSQPIVFKILPQLNAKQTVVDIVAKIQTKKIISQPIAAVTMESVKKDIKVEPSVSMSKPETPIPLVEKKQPFIVVIDAGHGGKDTGAIGSYKTREKDVVLAIALQLAAMVNKEPNMRAVLTRRGDYFVTLRNRLVLARKGEADLFVAIHADSYFNDHASGASVFALSPHGATTVAAKWLSDVDNHSELSDVELNRLSDQSIVLRSVLIDLAQTATIRDSLRFGNAVLDSLEDMTRLHSHRVEQAPFMVLKSPDIPSILVETGFISNRSEELHLRDKLYQREVALALLKGIRQYQKKYAPEGVE